MNNSRLLPDQVMRQGVEAGSPLPELVPSTNCQMYPAIKNVATATAIRVRLIELSECSNLP